MKPINFKQSNITFAQDHPKYGVLPALKYGEKGHVVSCWKLNFKESIRVLFLGKIWMRLTVFDGPLAPTLLTTNKKEVFPTPSITPLKGLIKFVIRTFIFLFCTAIFSLTPKHTVSQNDKILIKGKVAQQYQVSGTVTDQAGALLPGATVLIKGSTKGTTTNLDGHYSITVPDPANVLVFSSLGFKTKEITIDNHLPAGQIGTAINVSLQENIGELDEVTINAGYYKTSQRIATGSIGKIDAKIIEKQPVNNPLAAMQGRIAGVNITQVSGTPGGGFTIEVRGKNFLNAQREITSGDPFYIVDGVPYSSEILGQTLGNIVIPSGQVSPLNTINPSDIASIEVLKDADATAIYGSRGANGVVLITTKRGRAGKTQVKVNVSSTLGTVTGFLELLNTQQYLEMRKEALINDGYAFETASDLIRNSAPDLFAWEPDRYTDWQDVLLGGTAYRQHAHLSFSGGNEQTQFLFSGSYGNETTVFPGDSNYGKASVHSTINHQSADKRLQINVLTSYTADDNQLPGNDFTKLAYRLAPNAPALYDENGDLNWENSFDNPLAQLETEYRAQAHTLIMNSVISYHPTATLAFKTNLGYTNYGMEQYVTDPHTHYNPDSSLTSARSIVITNRGTRQSWLVEPQINWQKKWGKARLEILVGATFQQEVSNEIRIIGYGFPSNSQILDLSAANVIIIDSDEESENKYHAIFGRLNFNWADTYIINLTGRRDGSSKFSPGKQFGNFGAIGVAWLFSEEVFLADGTLLSFGKLRGSFGITGSDGIPNYGFYDSYDISSESYSGSGLQPSGLFNPNFAWETNKKLEAALELGFFKDRIFLTAAWYRNRSSNQLVGIPLPGTTGFSSINANSDAIVENTGFELDLRTLNIQNKDFNWTTTFNISVPKNKLVKFDGLESSAFKDRYVVGKPLSIAKLYHNTGVDPDTGVYQFEDYNKDGVIDTADRQWIEETAPKFYGGLGTILNYKNWTLDVFFNFKKQRATEVLLNTFVTGMFTNQHISVLNRWQQVGQAPIQRYTFGFNKAAVEANDKHQFSSASFTDTSFIRLKTISLTYAIPKDLIPGMNASIYVQGQNLFIVTKAKYTADAEQTTIGSWMPLLRQFTLGLQLGF